MMKAGSKLAPALLLSIALAGTVPGVLQAQSATAAVESIREFKIPAEPLNVALRTFAETTGLQLVYSSELVRNLRSGGLQGSYRIADGLQKLLADTGLTFRIGSGNTVVIEQAKANGARVLGPVRVEGATAQALGGVNGSTDPTATEGTHSYTSSALSIASKTPQSIRETPQSVSVITQQQMQDQNLTDFASVMNQATGVTVVTGGTGGTDSNLDKAFYSRGFQISSLQIDGGAPLGLASGGNGDPAYHPLIDMAMYDHFEILRGADGLFNGYGDPSGSVNLTRKRPLDHEQVVVEAAGGSWDNYREMVDATAPLGFDGKLRGRVVINNQDQNYFYDTANDKHILVYGIVEADISPSTVLSGGFSDTREDALPWMGGLMRYSSGADLDLPRSTCLCFNWNRTSVETREGFAQLEQHFGDDWSAKVNLTRNDQTSHEKYAYVGGFYQSTVNPVTLTGPVALGWMKDFSSVQNLADFTVNGAFELFGHRQQVVFGGNYSNLNGAGYQSYNFLYSSAARPTVDVFDFNPSDPKYVEPASSLPTTRFPVYTEQQAGAYATLRLTLFDPLHLIMGWRYSQYTYNYVSQSLCINVNSTSCSEIGEVSSSSRYGFGDHHLTLPPDVSMIYDLSKSLSAYASYTAIYQPQSTDLDESGKPLDPVKGSNIEVGLKWEGFSGKLNASIAAYRIEQRNYGLFIDYGRYGDSYGDTGDGIHYCCYTNDSDLVKLSRGVDAEVSGEALPGLQVSAGYTYNLNEYRGSQAATSEGQPLVTLSPKHLFKLWSSYQLRNGGFWSRLNVGGGVNAQSSSYTSGSACVAYVPDANGNDTPICQPNANIPFNFTQGFYAVFSGRVAYQFDRHWAAALNLNNIADRRYYQTVGDSVGGNWYGEPRNFMLTLHGSF